MHESRCEGTIVAVLPYRKQHSTSHLEYLARVEVCPAHSREFELCSITGGKEPELSVEATACLELAEEAGYHIEQNELLSLGIVQPSKASDTKAYLFAADISGKKQSQAGTDGSYFEQGASVKWVDYDQALTIEDPLLLSALARLHERL